MATGTKRRKMRKTAATVQKSTAMHIIARIGFVVNGLLHLIMGSLAFAVAFGDKNSEANHNGALETLSAGPIGGLILWGAVGGLWGLAFFQGLTTALVRGTSKKAWSDRAKPFFRGLTYFGLGFIAFRFATGNSPEGSEAQALSAQLMAHPGGVLIVAGIGLGMFIGGTVFWVMGIRGRFLNDLDTDRDVVNRSARVIGLVGYVSKGIAFQAIGVLFVIAAIQQDADQAAGLDGALGRLRDLPSGNVVLSVVALGFMLFGVYCLIRAKYERLDAPKR